ncbi:hypothetical protein A3I95_03300 [Candidatus Nomurabacteria bacterium RIFCSPLOWO2_02_FULL_44_12]|uniref:Transcriptional repressor PaaX-like central Cas2-like domain-containing protein n=1 Tax=Candidatus Nomurabacteria bacterium RIFCSPLOWO2_12_FULL_44_11 TaxID=1801796 RepID=A0A1F6Y7R6_9BACT|nr:MAG: hypothetical protein A3G53_00285 [Candidatus Nomurabacteria bacterium RIFCSPLOWO2_12_FULL_44_11]OGJ07624.1 MAG: hypothetical protein A3I95_03300 [Candidatus Nomurabacteria bacterium RIFCSPLOWO2_02_FULL_44_12]
MRGQILLKALEILQEGITTQMDFFEAVLTSGYGASMGKIDYEYNKIRRASQSRKDNLKKIQERKRRLQLFISQMKHDGLIEETGAGTVKLKISRKGELKLKELKNRLPGRHYQKESQKTTVIISFDIPEKLRRKRNWLRAVIKNLGFNMVHQSVWIGKVKIPEQFIRDLEELKILEFVEIFEISLFGTLKKL